jgi:hypothetical protein
MRSAAVGVTRPPPPGYPEVRLAGIRPGDAGLAEGAVHEVDHAAERRDRYLLALKILFVHSGARKPAHEQDVSEARGEGPELLALAALHSMVSHHSSYHLTLV